MDIGNLLAEADAEVDYDQDAFEDTEKLQQAIEQRPPDGAPPLTVSPRKASAASILQAAAQTIAKEERQEAQEFFREAAKEVTESVENARDPEGAAMKILLEASKEVNDLHNIPNHEPVRESESEKSESEPEEEEEDDREYDPAANRELIFACHNGNADAVRKLLKGAANILHRDRHGWTGLHWAAAKGHRDVLEELLHFRRSQGKSLRKFLHIQDHLAGWTALHVACVNNQRGAAQDLLGAGASPRKLDRMGERPVEVIGGSKNTRALRELFESKSDRERDADDEDRRTRSASPLR